MNHNNNKADVLVGLQWGDEGKGKIVDVLAPNYEIVARFQGGPNAGHSLVFNGVKHVLHTVPSGIFQKNCLNLVGNGVVMDPIVFCKELDKLDQTGHGYENRLLLSKRAHLILPTHRLLDAASEAAKGKEKIGSTLKGIGPAYMDKTGRNGLRIGDLHLPEFKSKYQALCAKHKQMRDVYGYAYQQDLPAMEEEWLKCIERIKQLPALDSEVWINHKLQHGTKVLAEGAQGSLLDIDFGTYPFVTSSNTISAGACTGLGLAPSRIGNVIGIFKAYCTRVGSGPFPTELLDETGEAMRKEGQEFGSTTGRPRRCGWLDLPALRHAIMLNGVTELAMMKADVLRIFNKVKVCTHYLVNGEKSQDLPYSLHDVSIEPVYIELPGWTDLQDGKDLPKNLEDFIQFIEEQTGVPVSVVSYGPDREQTLIRKGVLQA